MCVYEYTNYYVFEKPAVSLHSYLLGTAYFCYKARLWGT